MTIHFILHKTNVLLNNKNAIIQSRRYSNRCKWKLLPNEKTGMRA